MSTTFKTIANSAWGRLAMDRSRFRNRTIVEIDGKQKRDSFLEREDFIKIEGEESDYKELVKRKRSITETVPIHMAFFVLSNSKQVILETVNNLATYCDCSKLTMCYMDTGKS